MSPGLDTALTVAGFVLLVPGIIFVVGVSPFNLMMSDSMGPKSPKLHGYLVIAAAVLPPVLVLVLYLTAVVLACLAAGFTFYYPLVVLVAGAALWAGITTGAAVWIDRLK
jgi:hypothetical protein